MKIPVQQRMAAAVLALSLAACTSTAPTAIPSGPAADSPVPSSAAPTQAPTGSHLTATTAEPSPTASPATTAPPTAKPTPKSTPKPTPKPTPKSVTGWDPNHVTVKFTTWATVPGRPLTITNAGDGSGRLFVAEQGGVVYSVKNGAVNGTKFLDISGQVSGGGEQGLLGLAFHPNFPADNRVFVDYTDGGGDTVVASFVVDPGTPDLVDPTSEVVILSVAQPYSNHNGGAIAFGRDGYLYIGLGDGGSAGDPGNRAQDLNSLLGKILRIDIDHAGGGLNYAIPGSNPFAGASGKRGEIWAYGLRNPFRFSFDRTKGDLWIGDLGQNKWEEVDVARAGVGGLNFGWRIMEGHHCYSPATGCTTKGLTLPVVEYGHGSGCAVIGGNVYRGSGQPLLKGGYIFTDECTGLVWAVDSAKSGQQALVQVAAASSGIAGFGEDEAGELYAADLGGQIYKISAIKR
ncbi:MAG: PQQ-dependent sugar dehydrogenase [Chloroflexota bacterium]